MTKVTHTETHDNTLVCKGKLVLIISNERSLLYGVQNKVPNGKWLYSITETGTLNTTISGDYKWIKPIIVSETEDVEIGDKFYSPDGGIFICNKVDQYYIEAIDSRSRSGTTSFAKNYISKVLVSSENFSLEILKDIVDERLKDGDEVFVKCELNKWLNSNEEIGKRHTWQIKLDKDNHITILPEKKEWGWEDIEARFRQTDDYKFTTARNIHSTFIGWLQDNYNSPTKKLHERKFL